MIRKSFIGLASAIALAGAPGCIDDPNRTLLPDASDQGELDGSDTTEGTPDAGGSTGDAKDGGSSGSAEDATSDDGSLGGGRDDAGSEPGGDASNLDAGVDAGEDATTADAGTDAGEDGDADMPDAAPDAMQEDAGEDGDADMPDAAPDAMQEDAGEDGDADTADAAPDAMQEDAGGEPVLPELAAYYAFDEDTGVLAADMQGNFADATLAQGASWTPGVTGSAVTLAGNPSGNHVELPADILDHCDDVTVALWMNLGSQVPWSRLLEIDGLVNGFLFFTPTQDVAGEPHLFFNIYYIPEGAAGFDQGVSAAYPAETTLVGEWHHVAFTLSEGTGRLYFDGVEIGDNPMTVKPSDVTIAETAPPAQLGRSIVFPADAYLDAAIDDFLVSCTAFTAKQVAKLAQ